ncbi:hypothetical protein [Flavobacterium urocaniciphilum]|uniref:GLPGLI family protein n=1 Tax=Flavobacterium urocaniciphilum TaxID=1299341 RepID=A0A1H8YYR7_9FLAO|nr:hypothetical protein [Flavobacterium urocaniciphilum]SEP57349.1 hypothetical protein SAMN05444005_101371 [Flavobacterium urocaniciphilum]
MKKVLYLILLLTNISIAQNKQYNLDPNGKNSNFHYLIKTYPNNAMEFRVKKDSGTVYQITAPLYETIKSNYDTISKILPQNKKLKVKDSTIFFIQYFYKNDRTFFNEKNQIEVNNSYFSNFIKEQKSIVERKYKNSKVIYMFENGIDISNYKKIDNFFVDENNYFRTNYFKKSILCGSFLIIKPNGQSLIRNGEYRLDQMAEHLNSKIWELFFESNSINNSEEEHKTE